MASVAVKTFSYKARNAKGRVVKGKIEAPSEGSAVDRMAQMGLSPVELRETAAATGLNREIDFASLTARVKLKDLAIMSRQMSTMVAAGLSLLRTLTILAEQTESKYLRKLLATVARDVETGSSLSDALAKHPGDFPPLMINMIRAGETGGFLDGALETIAVNYEKETKLAQTIKSAMTYPIIVLIMAVLAVAAMLIFIVPVFRDMFEGMGSALPAPTQFLVVMSENMIWVAPLAIVLIMGTAIWWRGNKNSERVRKVIDPLKLKLPVFGGLFQKIAVTRFARNMSDMLKAGVPILRALVVVGETSGNWVVEHAARDVSDSVRQGQSVAAPLGRHTVFPPMVVQMVAVGEDSGSLEQMLDKVADFYDAEVQAMTEGLTALIEPLMVAFLGAVVGGMIVALYLPIFQMISLYSS